MNKSLRIVAAITGVGMAVAAATALPASATHKGSKQCSSSLTTGEVHYEDANLYATLDPGECITTAATFTITVVGSKFRVGKDYGPYAAWQNLAGDPYNGSKQFVPANNDVIYYDVRA